MTQWTYLAALLVSTACMALLDRRWRLVWWADRRRSAVVLVAGLATFLVWDLVAIRHGFYVRGGSAMMTGREIAKDLPVEELFFLYFLCYSTLVLHRLVLHWLEEHSRHRLPTGARR